MRAQLSILDGSFVEAYRGRWLAIATGALLEDQDEIHASCDLHALENEMSRITTTTGRRSAVDWVRRMRQSLANLSPVQFPAHGRDTGRSSRAAHRPTDHPPKRLPAFANRMRGRRKWPGRGSGWFVETGPEWRHALMVKPCLRDSGDWGDECRGRARVSGRRRWPHGQLVADDADAAGGGKQGMLSSSPGYVRRTRAGLGSPSGSVRTTPTTL